MVSPGRGALPKWPDFLNPDQFARKKKTSILTWVFPAITPDQRRRHMKEINSTRRRTLLKGTAAATAVSVVGCASPLTTSSRPRVVVVGGGWGGLGAVRALATGGKVDITLIEPNDDFMSCPLSILYIAGYAQSSDFQRSYGAVDALGVRRVKDRVVDIDRAGRTVKTATQSIPYDFLVLSTGLEYMEEALPGYAAARDQFPVGFRAFEQAAVQRQVAAFVEQGGNFVITVPKPPYRCPPAPYERACMIAQRMKEKGTKGKLIVVDANKHPMPPPLAKPMQTAMREMYGSQIEYITEADPKSIDAGRKVLSTSKGDIPFSHANIILPMRAPGLIRKAGLGERFAAVELPSFQSKADKSIFIIGDSGARRCRRAATSPSAPASRSASRSSRPSPASTRKPDWATRSPLPAAICWGKVSTSLAIMINVTSSISIGDPPSIKFQVDQAANAASSKGAMDWGKNIWNAMLG
ncbi:MAG: NAD(P)/FAD-dependent oxidoreductase [Burkholderiaceae bacterium]|nr:NAD(P)/FAD-dependent oxidoreductase [Burkholderiaceae bacterium]